MQHISTGLKEDKRLKESMEATLPSPSTALLNITHLFFCEKGYAVKREGNTQRERERGGERESKASNGPSGFSRAEVHTPPIITWPAQGLGLSYSKIYVLLSVTAAPPTSLSAISPRNRAQVLHESRLETGLHLPRLRVSSSLRHNENAR